MDYFNVLLQRLSPETMENYDSSVTVDCGFWPRIDTVIFRIRSGIIDHSGSLK
jgi:hypothetical protein